MAGLAASEFSRGGMKTKIEAARIATAAGAAMIITSADQLNPLSALSGGKKATWFSPSPNPINERKRWIAGGLDVSGQYKIDAGALKALASGKSLLPVGVVAVEGDFNRGDTIKIVGPDGRVVGRGLTEYDSADARKVLGLNSDQISERMGANVRTELIHRDDMAVDL